jgi:hypothetical protein
MPVARRRAVAVASGLALVASLLMVAQPASAAKKKTTKYGFPTNHTVFGFHYKVVASTHIKKMNQTITTPPGGIFDGEADFDTAQIRGKIKLPPITFTFSQAGVPLARATAQIVAAKPITGKINLNNFRVTTTSVFNMRIVSAYAATPSVPGVGPLPLPLPPVNLVGDQCTTEKPISVTMSGIAKIGAKTTFSGSFTIPRFKTCSVMTPILNQLVPGPGNTFTATARP